MMSESAPQHFASLPTRFVKSLLKLDWPWSKSTASPPGIGDCFNGDSFRTRGISLGRNRGWLNSRSCGPLRRRVRCGGGNEPSDRLLTEQRLVAGVIFAAIQRGLTVDHLFVPIQRHDRAAVGSPTDDPRQRGSWTILPQKLSAQPADLLYFANRQNQL